MRTLPIARGSRLSFLMSCPSPAPDWCGDFFGGSI
nr:MAG TPA: hypothetical protein [Caudoviricetes sp.]